ncbi:hypothetical protein [Halalkalibacter urbisdiaboli]|uniref:hypothetical protein n=1 Tax=Halalkalibacter urbisdiaboli TaxID=1960589 RepID=UPI000B43B2B9|nr:hypothetical protein [Halalkalibacter urbisdiaboli]
MVIIQILYILLFVVFIIFNIKSKFNKLTTEEKEDVKKELSTPGKFILNGLQLIGYLTFFSGMIFEIDEVIVIGIILVAVDASIVGIGLWKKSIKRAILLYIFVIMILIYLYVFYFK